MPELQPVHPVDERLPLPHLLLFGLQHVLVVAASPITAVFLVAKALNLAPGLTVNLIAATFLVMGVGTLFQSFGPGGIGARLPFIMVPGGAPVVMFVLIAQATDLQTAAGAVILAGVCYFIFLPIFRRCLRFFPRIVVGTILLLVAINLVKIYGGVIAGKPGTPEFGDPRSIGMALATVLMTVLAARFLRGRIGQVSVLLGLLAGSLLAWAVGAMKPAGVLSGAWFSAPRPFPFGMPRFNPVAEAMGQTVAIAASVERDLNPEADVPKTIRGDGLASLLGGLFGTSLIITSSENIGIVQATGVKSRYVTATAGVLLLAIAGFAPLSRLAAAIPASVVGGTALIVFSIIGVMGINLLRDVDLKIRANLFTLASGLLLGLLPIVVPGIFSRAPQVIRPVVDNGLAMGVLAAVVINILFNHLQRREGAPAPAPATGEAQPAHSGPVRGSR
jgi:uracil-xanthine permease